MNLLKELTEIAKEENVTVKQSFDSVECNEYEFFDNDNRKICYIVETFINVDEVVYELYCDNYNLTNKHEDDDFRTSYEYDEVEHLENALIFDVFN